jgi:hypothetical protein
MQRILEKEMAVLATIRHPNLCSFHGETTSDMGTLSASLPLSLSPLRTSHF